MRITGKGLEDELFVGVVRVIGLSLLSLSPVEPVLLSLLTGCNFIGIPEWDDPVR